LSKEYLCHYDALDYFNTLLFSNVFTTENIKSTKKAIILEKDHNDPRIKTLKNKYYGYYLEKKGKRYFLPDSNAPNGASIDSSTQMPLKAITTEEVDYKGEVFIFINEIESTKIPAKKILSYRELIDNICCFKHTNELHLLLWKIIVATAITDRINFRVVAEAGFGKDSLVDSFKSLVNSTSNIYGATFAKMEYHLKNKFLLFNEMGNLKPEDKFNFQQFFLATGAYSNTYAKRSRKTEATLEEYNISKTSIGISYNPPEYYISKGQDYFETLFTSAVVNRFIPFFFEGRLTTDFSKLIDTKTIVKENMDLYKAFVATLHYYRKNNLVDVKYSLPENVYFSTKQERYNRTFMTLCKYIAEYAIDEKEFQELVTELFKCYRTYVERHIKEDIENQ
jgi:hypothetical protein